MNDYEIIHYLRHNDYDAMNKMMMNKMMLRVNAFSYTYMDDGAHFLFAFINFPRCVVSLNLSNHILGYKGCHALRRLLSNYLGSSLTASHVMILHS